MNVGGSGMMKVPYEYGDWVQHLKTALLCTISESVTVVERAS